eukprot:CAMPEP_0175230080 /NCGR_PEP_ID=MMETSP0093-20121207/24763_1 /TAXON_ID=311494 /ORGANISM="Alexandrium monilatum, Strain CCMP3105" /LENGTH=36 /DNA_ID= /DNA_START= /DNA_END= /DNA_ORIENTATION=
MNSLSSTPPLPSSSKSSKIAAASFALIPTLILSIMS